MIRGLVFDLDGTIISIGRDGAAFRSTTAAHLRRNGFDMSQIRTEKGVQDMLDQALVQLRQGRVNVDYAQLKRQIFNELDELESLWVREARLLPGVAEALSDLKPVVPRFGLLTNSGGAATAYAVGKFGLDEYFDYIFTRDTVPSMKPSPDGLILILDTMGVERSEALFVGDSVYDIRAARAAGVKVASVLSGPYDAEMVKREQPDYVLGSLTELRPRLAF